MNLVGMANSIICYENLCKKGSRIILLPKNSL